MVYEKTAFLNDHKEELMALAKMNAPFLFFDFDGTLTPIVATPDLAFLSEHRKKILSDIKMKMPIAIVSGRNLIDLKERVGVEGIYYVGSHGLEIETPEGELFQIPIPRLAQEEYMEVTSVLQKKISPLPGIFIENKHFCFAVHYRLADVEVEKKALELVFNSLSKTKYLSLQHGKRVVEVKPNVDWHKGSAVLWILEREDSKKKIEPLVFYFGDDATDENAFKTLDGKAVTVCVMNPLRKTNAGYFLNDVEEVYSFIASLDFL
ncbi:trehalose-phosphatase [Criblamydia sequanensis]|uniref:Trehalose 6-phosphate phosphatase n=1 Tax=Candidatus Criblamydia sequanensis CRIB-18 TaxID=1437425 RepID=A0A090E1P3_9BACT|nr:trehalose-phosphatase [Criblamydia sequanensis]CDR34659.1 Trehalose-phosphate phosphatase [Criblamydia sequanensis CRIB-18]